MTISGIEIPTIFITGNDSARVRKEVSDTDCRAFLVKPFPVKSLIDAVANAAL
jgi:FixJ family two-component response regulator